MDSKDALVVFEGTKIRRIWHDEQWFFSVIDIIEILTDSPTPRQYWGKIKDREFAKLELSPIWVRLKLPAEDGKLRFTDCINTQNAFRLIQSIPSKKAEPFKQWLAKVGYERVQEIENPELAQERMKQLYEQKGYSQEWIEKRIRGIAIRQELTDEWKERGIDQNLEYAILTNEISKATFGKTVDEYKNYKKLKKENLRDHMTDLELIFTMLGEKVTTKITGHTRTTPPPLKNTNPSPSPPHAPNPTMHLSSCIKRTESAGVTREVPCGGPQYRQPRS
jgi:DNA-damage-inducible protein D